MLKCAVIGMVNDVAWIIKDNKASFRISALLRFQVLNSRYIFHSRLETFLTHLGHFDKHSRRVLQRLLTVDVFKTDSFRAVIYPMLSVVEAGQ